MAKIGQYIQSFASGYIARDGEKYQYVQGEKIVGTYDSTDELVADQMKGTNLSSTDGTSFKDTLKSKPAKATKKKTAKK